MSNNLFVHQKYETVCMKLESATTQREYEKISKEHSVNHRSILDELKYFKVSSGTLLPDVMHYILEGMLEYECKEVLKHTIIDEAYFTLEYLNHQITNNDLGLMESRDRPSCISITNFRCNDHKLKQEGTGSDMLINM